MIHICLCVSAVAVASVGLIQFIHPTMAESDEFAVCIGQFDSLLTNCQTASSSFEDGCLDLGGLKRVAWLNSGQSVSQNAHEVAVDLLFTSTILRTPPRWESWICTAIYW